MRNSRLTGLFVAILAILMVGMLSANVARSAPEAQPFATVMCCKEAGPQERLAVREVRRYLYLRTGLLPQLFEQGPMPESDTVIVARKDRPVVDRIVLDTGLRKEIIALKPQEYRIATLSDGDQRTVLVVGGDGSGVLYGAYRLAEHLGVRFYLHGDVIPDERMSPKLPDVEDTGKPLFNMRGILPFHDFPEGPDWWTEDDYKAFIAQLPKLRMNFIGFHCYPEGGVGPELAVWIGRPEDIGQGSDVEFSYPSSWMNTLRGNWGYRAKRTDEFVFGASELFERDAYGPEIMKGMYPEPKEPEACNRLFRKAGLLFKNAFSFAHDLGVKTCVGTETPLTVPERVKRRLLKAKDKKELDQADILELYRGMFRRIAQTHPLDYYWFWTPEGWTWQGASEEQVQKTLKDLQTAIEAAEKEDAPFTLATCGWVLGPPQDRAMFDDKLPNEMPMSCINREVGHAPVEPGFSNVEGRPQWAIPWLEDDPALTSPQLWVGRMRKDAVDSLNYGCTGLMGIHWRTRSLGPNVLALARAAWKQGDWSAEEPEKAEGPVGGNHAGFTQSIAETENDPLYQTVRYDVSAYNLRVPNGTYTVTLKFCEPHYGEAGKRVFGVSLEGKQVIEQLDIFKKVGKDRALDYTFKTQVKDGWLDIDFHKIVEFPSIAAIHAEGPEATVQVNCGGSSYEGYRADWPPNRDTTADRYLSCADFYDDWAESQFGSEAADAISEVFTKIDGQLPRPSTWVGGPGGMNPDGRPWKKVKKEYSFVDELAALRPRVEGKGNLSRFDYWLNQFRYMRAMAKVRCTWAEFNKAMKAVEGAEDDSRKKKLARERALPVRKELVDDVEEVYDHMLAYVSMPGEMGTVANWEQHILPSVLEDPGQKLKQVLGELPAEAVPSDDYSGPSRIIVPTRRTVLKKGEELDLKLIILTNAEVESASVYSREMGSGSKFATVPIRHVARDVYRASLPAEATSGRSIEYYVEAKTDDDETLRYPATAPRINQTVVVWQD